jgi:hypothetical protein
MTGPAQGASILIVDDEPELAPTFGKPFALDDVRRVIDQVLHAR